MCGDRTTRSALGLGGSLPFAAAEHGLGWEPAQVDAKNDPLSAKATSITLSSALRIPKALRVVT